MDDMHGQLQTMHAAPLVLPVWSASDVTTLPVDETVVRRLQEVAFADLNLQVREMLRQGKRAQAQAALVRAQAQVSDHPWLAGKLERLRDLMESDAAMAQKDMLYSSGKMRSRLVARFESNEVADETASFEVPAFLRRKASEGTGRSNP